jgi:serine/threonine protein kinase
MSESAAVASLGDKSAVSVVGDRYQLREVIGRGGMGCVWRAYDPVLRREVAVKELLAPPGTADADLATLRGLAVGEAQTAARVNHPNSVRILDIVDALRWPWIVMEYVPSWSLHQLLTSNGPLPPRYVAAVGVAVLDALTAAHRVGVLHRDVKPGNVLIGHDGRVVLVDFGIARWNGRRSVGAAQTLGTAQYLPPERASVNLSLPEGDLYSLGATLYTAVEGRGPHQRESVGDTLAALVAAPPDQPRRAGELAAVLWGLLQRDPGQRLRPDQARLELSRVAGGLAPDPGRRDAAIAVRPRGIGPWLESTIAVPVAVA